MRVSASESGPARKWCAWTHVDVPRACACANRRWCSSHLPLTRHASTMYSGNELHSCTRVPHASHTRREGEPPQVPSGGIGERCRRAVTSLGVTGCRKEIAKDRDNVARMSRDVARMSRCRGVSRKIVRVHKASTVTSTRNSYVVDLDQRCDITTGSHRTGGFHGPFACASASCRLPRGHFVGYSGVGITPRRDRVFCVRIQLYVRLGARALSAWRDPMACGVCVS